MRYYETLYILNPEFEQERIDNIIKEVDDEVCKFSDVINHRVWNKKRLAYPVEKHKYGFYVILQFESEDPSALIGFENILKLNKSILRFQNVRLDAQPEKVEANEVSSESKKSIEEEPKVENNQETPIETTDVSVENEAAKEVAETVEEETSA